MRINNALELRIAIEALEAKRQLQKHELISQFHETADSLKPGNLIKSAMGNIMPSAVLGSVLKTAGTVGVGLLTGKLMGGVAGASTGGKLLSNLLNQTASRTVINNVDTIKAYGTAIIHNLFKSKKKQL